MSILKTLPIIIDGPGEYLTRDGRRVEILDLNGNGTLNCHGHYYTPPKPGKVKTKRTYSIWHVSGRFMFVGESARDVVSKVNQG